MTEPVTERGDPDSPDDRVEEPASMVRSRRPVHPVRILCVANKRLPPTDYRIVYGRLSSMAHVVFGLPESPRGLAEEDFVRLSFREGLELRDVGCFISLFQVLRHPDSRPDLVHFYSTKLTLLGPLIARLAGVPSVTTVTGFGRVFSDERPHYRLLRWLYHLLLFLSLRTSKKVLFQNRSDLRATAERFPGYEDRLLYVGSAVGMPAMEAKEYRGGRLRVLLVSRLIPSKGIDHLLSVARRLRHSDIRFRLVGPPSSGYEDLAERVRAAASEGIVEYREELHGEELLEEYRKAHVFFFPSTYAEGLARVMLEAGFAGLCPVAFDIASNRDLLGPGRGFMLPEPDAEAVSDVLSRLDGDRELLERQARRYQAFVVREYSEEAYVARLDEIVAGLDIRSGDGGR